MLKVMMGNSAEVDRERLENEIFPIADLCNF
jgi:hypothetical protein